MRDCRDAETQRLQSRRTDSNTDRRQTYIQKERKTNWKADRQKDRQKDRQEDRQKDRRTSLKRLGLF